MGLVHGYEMGLKVPSGAKNEGFDWLSGELSCCYFVLHTDIEPSSRFLWRLCEITLLCLRNRSSFETVTFYRWPSHA